ncbi:MAG: BamA/TamA family outer membrane protein, partial [Pseudomonadota bacterium]
STENGIGLIFELSELNFLGRGQTLNDRLATGEDNSLFSLKLVEPGLFDRDLAGGLRFNFSRTNNDDALYDTQTFEISPSLGFPVSENGRVTTGVFVRNRDLFDVSSDAAGILQDEGLRGDETTYGLAYSYSFDNRRSGLNPRAGVLLRVGQEFAFGDSQFVETTALAAAETRVLGEDVLLRATLEGGALNYLDGTSRVTDRFFLGSRRMRGFRASGIGPRERGTSGSGEAFDDALGGEFFAVARLEAEFPIGLPEEYGITGGVFFDYGSVWNIGDTSGATGTVFYDDFTPRSVVGVAILWDSPLGPLRFNFSDAIQKEEFDDEQEFDLTISTSF